MPFVRFHGQECPTSCARFGDPPPPGDEERDAKLTNSHHSENAVFVGDTLFAGSIGRTDFPGGDFGVLKTSIREKLFTLDDDVTVYPGHMGLTTIGREKRTNPFVGI